MFKCLALTFCALCLLGLTGMAKAQDNAPNRPALTLDANNLSYVKEADQVIAEGAVDVRYEGYHLTADKVIYDRKTGGQVDAKGNVILRTPTGDVHKADAFTLSGDMREGVATALSSILADGSHVMAQKGRKEGKEGERIVMESGAYTPCPMTCTRGPTWQINAKEVVHDKTTHNVAYRDARFSFFGVPVLYTPYFTHPDGSVKQRSGFLTPRFGYVSELGFKATQPYYWGISPNQDATVGITAFTKQAPLALGEWRRKWEDKSLTVESSITHAKRDDNTPEDGKDWRGHFFADGLWDINREWRMGGEARLVTDDQFLRRYDIDEDADVLTNQIFAERFSGRDYASVRGMDFRDLRVTTQEIDQPSVLPEATARFLGEAGTMPFVGGRWGVDASFLGLYRGEGGQDMRRASATGEWVGRSIADMGLVTDWRGAVRQDVYYIADYQGLGEPGGTQDPTTEGEYTRGRFFPQAHVQSAYPLARSFGTKGARAILTPIAALTAGGDINEGAPIPNEDSRDVQLDASNLFETDRFTGLDKIEDGAWATYGLRGGVHGADGSLASAFLGQSYRFDGEDNPFPDGSGLETDASDVVGQLELREAQEGSVLPLPGLWDLDYRYQLDSKTLASRRHEVDITSGFGPVTLGGRYLFSKALEGTTLTQSREQAEGRASYQVTKEWGTSGRVLYDLGEDEGLREMDLGLIYTGPCTSWAVTVERDLTDGLAGQNETSVMFRFGLKNLGEF